GPDHNTSARDIKRYDLEALAHDAKLILYQGYREWNCIPIHWGALVDLHGEKTARYDAAKAVNQMIAAHESLWLRAKSPRAQVGILYSPANAILCQALDAQKYLHDALRGVYQAVWSLGVPVEFVTPEILTRAESLPYQILFLPFQMLVSHETGQALARFVENGGILV